VETRSSDALIWQSITLACSPLANRSRKGRPHKSPKATETPILKKQPRSDEPSKAEQLRAWRFSSHDTGGPWAWTNLDDPAEHKRVVEQLQRFEQMSWDAIKKQGSHLIQRDRLEKRARDRLQEIKQDDLDELMSFRLTGTQRVWCIKGGEIMKILWWDPDHEVYPVSKKHT
jgi:hypothetical protein